MILIPDGQSKRKPGNVCAQLLPSAVVLLVPPVLMVAGVMYLGSPSEGAGQKIGADRADKRPELATSPALMSAEQRSVIVGPRSVAEGPASSTQKQITKDSTRYIGPVTVGDGSEQLTTVEVESPQPAAVADLSSTPEQLPAERRRSPARSTTLHLPDTVAVVEEAHGLKNGVVLPPRYPALLARRALSLQDARLTCCGSVAVQHLASFLGREPIGQPLAGRTELTLSTAT
jgi:hypothetical protein